MTKQTENWEGWKSRLDSRSNDLTKYPMSYLELKVFIANELEEQRAKIIAEIQYRVPEEFKKHYKALDADTLCADIVAKLVHSITPTKN